MDDLIEQIIKNRLPVYFVSPHLDDAIFSAGDLIAFLSDKTEVGVINIFTEGGGDRETLSAKQFLRQCGVKDGRELFEERRREDSEVLTRLGIKPKNLGHLDALWRTKGSRFPLAELNAVYPIYRFHITSGKIARADEALVEGIVSELRGIISGESIVFAPIGIGKHVDHIITREVCSRLGERVFYFADFPYDRKNGVDEFFVKVKKLKRETFLNNLSKKSGLISGYISQVRAMFPDGLIKLQSETYYLPKETS